MGIERLTAELDICHLHEERLNISLRHLQPLIPLTPVRLKTISDEALAFLDMVATRFGKLQDTLGKKVFPLLLQRVGEYEEQETFIDRLNRLERLGIITSAAQWQELRAIRNLLAHEYTQDPQQACLIINHFIQQCQALLAIWQSILHYVERKHLLHNPETF